MTASDPVHYVILGKWSPQGVRKVRDMRDRYDTIRGAAEQLGDRFLSLHLTLGRYDFVALLDLPSDEALKEVALHLDAHDTRRSLVMKAWTLDEASEAERAAAT